MEINKYLDSTYLKTAKQAKVSKTEDLKIVEDFIKEAIQFDFKLVMIRPKHVALAKKLITEKNSKVLIGTVIDFPKGQKSIDKKIIKAQKAILDGADDLDFVCNYEAFKNGEIDVVKNEIYEGTQFALENNKTIKWIIEVAALNHKQIIQLCTLIKNVVMQYFKEEKYQNVFVKSSTGFYITEKNLPNGATKETILLMLENSFPLPVKAAGGIRNYEDAIEMITMGVKRIGTSAAKEITDKNNTNVNLNY